ncbi:MULTISPECIES: hypothetical protein [unclassified Streptomyces]|uniref:hypothetical protein n=1 Tax=unclassified Streptomyces TaxID=2593676 RepID=UPI0029A91D71|nr:hypothetical protein [Streptomyces sp. ME19-01-6]MDX3224585.1 hypothetical protein [Streptomyces sp. ME19-01-6]
MTTSTVDPAAYLVVAEVIHGPLATPILGKGLFCSIECAAVEVRELSRSISERGQGAAFVLQHQGRPVGCAVTRGGQMWVVQVLASHELPATN